MITKVKFKLPADAVANATSGMLIGEFNNWNPEEGILLQRQEDGSMGAELSLTAGHTYEYRYLLNDGRWVNDDNMKKFSDVFGSSVQNCVVVVPEIIERLVTSKRNAGKKITDATTTGNDDLAKIEGINKKVAALLIKQSVKSYKDLSKCTIKKLQLILDGAGSAFSIHNPATWPKQAKLAASGKWEELSRWQEEMKAV